VDLTCRASYFILPLVPSRFFLLTSYQAITAHLWELVARLFLLVSRLSLPMLFH
jgi:hypothetical protein